VAKKPRTPPPPRRVQAPKQRHAPRQGLSAERTRTILYGVAAAGAVGLVVVLVVVLAGGKSGRTGNAANIRPALTAAGCTLSTTKATPSANHTTSLNQPLKYATYPPVSGNHYYLPAIWGNYSLPVDPRQAVHNQEHGGIVIWVGPDVSAAERQQITNFYDESPNAMLVTAIENTSKGVTYPKHAPPDSKVFLTAWVTLKPRDYDNATAQIASCPHFSEKAFAAFRDEFRGDGPEPFPVSGLKPGT
jgi:hypothetical protein